MSPQTSRPADAVADDETQQSPHSRGEKSSDSVDLSTSSARLPARAQGRSSGPHVGAATLQTSRHAPDPRFRGSRTTRARRARGITGGVLSRPASNHPARPSPAPRDTRNEPSWRSQISPQPSSSSAPHSRPHVGDQQHYPSGTAVPSPFSTDTLPGGHTPIGRQQGAAPHLTYGTPSAVLPALNPDLGQPIMTQTGHAASHLPYGADASQTAFAFRPGMSQRPPQVHQNLPSDPLCVPSMPNQPDSSTGSTMLGAPSPIAPYHYGAHSFGQHTPYSGPNTIAGPPPNATHRSFWQPHQPGPPLPSSMHRNRAQRSEPPARPVHAKGRGQNARVSANDPSLSRATASSGRGTPETGILSPHPSGLLEEVGLTNTPEAPTLRSEYVMWVGNVPSSATQESLSTFFSAGLDDVARNRSDVASPDPILSIFIIARSNCAFVNFVSEELLNEAVKRFNGSVMQLDGSKSSRLICRVRNRQEEAQSGVRGQRSKHIHVAWLKEYNRRLRAEAETDPASSATVPATGREVDPVAAPLNSSEAASAPEEVDSGSHSSADVSYASTNSEMLCDPAFVKRFFILKSLDVKDLDKALTSCLWSTQPHNEKVLDQAYRTSQEVILIFSANQSGAFYGYARMAGPIESVQKPEATLRTSEDEGASSAAHALFPEEAVKNSPEPLEGFEATSAGGGVLMRPSMDQSVSASLSHLTVQQERQASAAAPRSSDRGAHEAIWGSSDGVVRRDMASFNLEAETSKDADDTASALSAAETASKSLETTAMIHNMRLDSPEGGQLLPGLQSQGTQPGAAREVDKTSMDPANRGGKGSPSRLSSAQAGNALGSHFRIEWLQTRSLPFSAVKHLRNAWNEGRTIRVARDGTEVAIDTGMQFLDVWERHVGGSTN